MLVKINAKNVIGLLGGNYEMIYHALQDSVIGNNFVERQIGAGYFQWALPDGNWKPLLEAGPIEEDVKTALDVCLAHVREAFEGNQNLAKNVITVPNKDDYVFYKVDESGQVLIKLTAWGYKYPTRIDGGGFVIPHPDLPKKQHVRVGFKSDGKLLTNYGFKIENRAKITSQDGFCLFGDLFVGSKYAIKTENGMDFILEVQDGQELYLYEVIDEPPKQSVKIGFTCDGLLLLNYRFKIDNCEKMTSQDGYSLMGKMPVGQRCQIEVENGRTFLLEVKDGQDEYLYDVTELPQIQLVKIGFTCDGLLLSNYRFKIDNCEKMTSQDGYSLLGEIPVGQRFQIEVENGKTFLLEVLDRQDSYLFDVTVPPDKKFPVEIRVSRNGVRLKSYDCVFDANGEHYEGKTDDFGSYKINVDYCENMDCLAKVGGIIQKKTADKSGLIFVFDLPRQIFNPYIKVVDGNGQACKAYSLKVNLNGNETDFVSDSEGKIQLPAVPDGSSMTVSDVLSPENSLKYSLVSAQLEYLFRVSRVIKPQKSITIMVKDEKGAPIPNASLLLSQKDGSNFSCSLDDNGIVSLDKSRFTDGQPLTAAMTINGELIQPITFELDDNEDIYVLQAEKTASNMKSRILEFHVAVITILFIAYLYFSMIELLF